MTVAQARRACTAISFPAASATSRRINHFMRIKLHMIVLKLCSRPCARCPLCVRSECPNRKSADLTPAHVNGIAHLEARPIESGNDAAPRTLKPRPVAHRLIHASGIRVELIQVEPARGGQALRAAGESSSHEISTLQPIRCQCRGRRRGLGQID